MQYFLLALLVVHIPLLQGAPTSSKDNRIYQTSSEYLAYGMERIELAAGHFRYWSASHIHKSIEGVDLSPKYPMLGDYRQTSDRVELLAPPFTVYFRASINGIDVLLTEQSLSAWQKDISLIDPGVLIYIGTASVSGRFPEPASRRSLQSKEALAAQEKAYEDRFNNQPPCVRDLLRSATDKKDPEKLVFRREIVQARDKLTPELVNTLVALIGSEDEVTSCEAGGVLDSIYLRSEWIDVVPKFATDLAAFAKVGNMLVSALPAARNKFALEWTLWTFARLLRLEKIDLILKDCGVQILIENHADGLPHWNSRALPDNPIGTPSPAWEKEIDRIALGCKAWCQEQLHQVESNPDRVIRK